MRAAVVVAWVGHRTGRTVGERRRAPMGPGPTAHAAMARIAMARVVVACMVMATPASVHVARPSFDADGPAANAKSTTPSTYTVMACIAMAYVVMAHTGMACMFMAYVVMAYTPRGPGSYHADRAYIVTAYIVTAYIVMARALTMRIGHI